MADEDVHVDDDEELIPNEATMTAASGNNRTYKPLRIKRAHAAKHSHKRNLENQFGLDTIMTKASRSRSDSVKERYSGGSI